MRSAVDTGQLLTQFDSAINPATYVDYVWAELRAACPSGVAKCECLNNPGKACLSRARLDRKLPLKIFWP